MEISIQPFRFQPFHDMKEQDRDRQTDQQRQTDWQTGTDRQRQTDRLADKLWTEIKRR